MTRPSGLPIGIPWCEVHRRAWHLGVSKTCPECKAGKPAPAPRPRKGAETEKALQAALDDARFVWIEDATLFSLAGDERSTSLDSIYIPEYTWAPHERNWRADFAFPVARVLVEIDGNAHAVKRQRTADVLKRQEAQRRGWTVVTVLPEQVRDGSAVEIIKAALAAKEVDRG